MNMESILDIKSMFFILSLMLLSPHLSFAQQYDFSEQEEAEFEPVGSSTADAHQAVSKNKTKKNKYPNTKHTAMILDKANELLDKSYDLIDQADKLMKQGYRSLASALLSQAVASAKEATKKAAELHDVGGTDNVFESKKIHAQAAGALDKVRKLLIKKPKDV